MEPYTRNQLPLHLRIQDKRYPRYYKKMRKRGIKVKLCKYRQMRRLFNPKKWDLKYAIAWDGVGNPRDGERKPWDAWDDYVRELTQ